MFAGHSGTENFRNAVSRAALLTVGHHFVNLAIRMSGNLILTRVLMPEAFGLMLVATAIWMGLVLLSDCGFRQVLVRSPNATQPDFLNTVWTLQLIQGAVITALLLLIAAGVAWARDLGLFPAASTLAMPELPWILAGLSLAALLSGAQSTKLDLACRQMRLGPVYCIEVGSQFLALPVMVGLALWTHSVHSLVAGACFAAGCKALCSHILLTGPNNQLRWSREAAHEIFGFGRWVIVTSCLGFVISNGDRLVLAWLLTLPQMGNYAIAALLIGVAHDVVGKLVTRVVYPALGGAVTQGYGIRGAYLKARRSIDIICVVAAGLVATCGDLVVGLLYDDRYVDAGDYLRVLALSLLGVRYRVLSQVYLVIGRPRLMVYEKLLHAFGLGAGIFVGFRLYGAAGAISGVALSYLLAQLWNVFCGQPKLGLLSVRTELLSVAWFGAALAMGLAVRAVVR
jgi:O-antigen/teichoic acid export membrane protein